jgi:hypothetical protein
MNEFEKSLQNIDVNIIYDQLSKIEVPLEMQSTYNRHYIDQKIVECDKALDLLDKINTKVVRELTNYEIRHSVVEEEINNKKRNEFANNQEILKRYSTGRERESAIELLIKDSMSEFSKLNRKILALRNLSGLIKTKQSIIIKKMRNIQDQSRMMSDLLKINVPLPDDKDTALLTKALGGVEALERSLDAEEVEDARETQEQSDLIEEITEESSISIDLNESESLNASITETESTPSDVTEQVSKNTASSEVDTSDLDLGNTDPQSSTEVELDSTPTDKESETLSDETPEENEESELDMDTVLDGLDPINSSEEGTTVEIEPESSDAVVNEGSEDTLLEDIISGDDTVVTDKPAKKSGQGEPSSKDKKSKKESKATEKPPEKVLKEDNATAPGDVNIDNILDDLNNI